MISTTRVEELTKWQDRLGIRRVEFLPETTVFNGKGSPCPDLQEQVLAVEELEALRLKDLEGLEQGGMCQTHAHLPTDFPTDSHIG